MEAASRAPRITPPISPRQRKTLTVRAELKLDAPVTTLSEGGKKQEIVRLENSENKQQTNKIILTSE
jgi:hypothetical protein